MRAKHCSIWWHEALRTLFAISLALIGGCSSVSLRPVCIGEVAVELQTDRMVGRIVVCGDLVERKNGVGS